LVIARTVLAILLMTGIVSVVAAEPDLVVVVRHAEKAKMPLGDPALSDAGQARAKALADALAYAGIDAIFTTQYRRTRETAALLAQHTGVEAKVVDAGRGDTAAHIAEVAHAIRAERGRVLVVGHSNTVAGIVAALGGPTLPDLCDTSYGHAFLLVPRDRKVALLHLRYGEADPMPASDCL
jgi:phosphohistidine phosphatase SixA